MSEKLPSKDEALEALDFIVNVLKEHEKDLDRLVNELGTVAGQLGESSELNGKVKKIEDKLSVLQSDVGNMVKSFASGPKEPKEAPPAQKMPATNSIPEIACFKGEASGFPVSVLCKQWEDFQVLAAQPHNVSFAFKEGEKSMTVSALKNSSVISFQGETPKTATLLKAYLSRKLGVPEQQILEGEIAPR